MRITADTTKIANYERIVGIDKLPTDDKEPILYVVKTLNEMIQDWAKNTRLLQNYYDSNLVYKDIETGMETNIELVETADKTGMEYNITQEQIDKVIQNKATLVYKGNIKKIDSQEKTDITPAQPNPTKLTSQYNVLQINKNVLQIFCAPMELLDKYPDMKKIKLGDGKTFEQRITDIANYMNKIHGNDLYMYIKLLNFIHAGHTAQDKNELSDMFMSEDGFLTITLKLDKDFYKFFIDYSQYKNRKCAKRQEENVIEWLLTHQNGIEIPTLLYNIKTKEQCVKITQQPLYKVDEYVYYEHKKAYYTFQINTNIIDINHTYYTEINIAELDIMQTEWDKVVGKNQEYSDIVNKYQLDSFSDLPLRLLITLKTIYNRMGNATNKKTGYMSNSQRLSPNELDKRLGNLDRRLMTHLKESHNGGYRKNFNSIYNTLLCISFDIAKNLKWLANTSGENPDLDKDGNYRFSLNKSYFDHKRTAEAMKKKRKNITT